MGEILDTLIIGIMIFGLLFAGVILLIILPIIIGEELLLLFLTVIAISYLIGKISKKYFDL